MELSGKKAFCFLALKHHSRFLLPVTRELERQGMEVKYLTAPAEMPFELTLQEEGLPYVHTQAYLDPAVAAVIDEAYRRVRAAWREKFLAAEVLHHFTLPVQDKTLRAHTENFYLFRRMFEAEKPDLVLALHELNSWGKMLGYLSHEFGVPFVTMQEGLYYAPAAVYRFHTEYSSACLVWGEATREVLVRSGGSAEKIFVVGNTHLHAVLERERSREAIERTRHELRIRREDKIVTLLMAGLGYDKGFIFPQTLLDWARAHPDWALLFKWHPVTNKLTVEQVSRALASLDNVRVLQDFDTYRLLAASDLCVVFGNSTSGLEALAFGKPLIEVELPGLDYSFAREGVADPVSSLAELPVALERAVASGVPDDRRRKVDDYLRRNLDRLDGKSVERCVAAVKIILAARESPRRAAAVTRNAADFQCSVIVPLSGASGGLETLLGVAEHTGPSYECMIAAPAGSERQPEWLDSVGGDVSVVRSEQDTPGALCNRAAEKARGRYLCFLRPGWVPQKGWLEGLLQELERDPNTGIAGGLALFADSLLAHAGIALDANLTPVHLYQYLPANFTGAHRRRRMRAVAGCLLVRREAFEAAGGFDERYRTFWSELDFCFRAGGKGWTVAYTPQSLFVCLGRSHDDDPDDRLLFFGRWTGHLWPDQESYWAEEGLDPEGLSSLYREVARGEERSCRG
ncbi:MAG TPA: UDP-N-acetylglucosamine 2-epimerase [candidate division Zixibacteria bacterium]|nr:UDP-N-acetylglucosamine 2-epimerase [candidate division Zixibacteria bacterium]